jgi:hypothetical protein
MESIIETKAVTLVQFLQGLRGELHVTLEEGPWAAWLYDVLKPRGARRGRLAKAAKKKQVSSRSMAYMPITKSRPWSSRPRKMATDYLVSNR